ncbi:hypothetical protein J8273_3972 [Carpediemonas membranifera]|uniref:Uncharacterized protein n=1 Tax=Carpediemonas membranifera TaxID=201153 RepID=A0A8J6B2I6_9EUKA|nr:hypothetical protein J8273_3972 [Carpediemonas membranifera]|eukprot:KAG9394338.1 hypothetical protein J8273_3972 [Carpediemonas membranifera]
MADSKDGVSSTINAVANILMFPYGVRPLVSVLDSFLTQRKFLISSQDYPYEIDPLFYPNPLDFFNDEQRKIYLQVVRTKDKHRLPLGMKNIIDRIQNFKYVFLWEVIRDIYELCDNARTYNAQYQNMVDHANQLEVAAYNTLVRNMLRIMQSKNLLDSVGLSDLDISALSDDMLRSIAQGSFRKMEPKMLPFTYISNFIMSMFVWIEKRSDFTAEALMKVMKLSIAEAKKLINAENAIEVDIGKYNHDQFIQFMNILREYSTDAMYKHLVKIQKPGLPKTKGWVHYNNQTIANFLGEGQPDLPPADYTEKKASTKAKRPVSVKTVKRTSTKQPKRVNIKLGSRI